MSNRKEKRGRSRKQEEEEEYEEEASSSSESGGGSAELGSEEPIRKIQAPAAAPQVSPISRVRLFIDLVDDDPIIMQWEAPVVQPLVILKQPEPPQALDDIFNEEHEEMAVNEDEYELDEEEQAEADRRARQRAERAAKKQARLDAGEPKKKKAAVQKRKGAEPPAPRRARPVRAAAGGLSGAFTQLRDGNLNAFLEHWNVQTLLEPVFTLLGSFGQGHRKATVIRYWKLYWRGQLLIRSLLYPRQKQKCSVCGLRRRLTYAFYLRTDQLQSLSYFKDMAFDDDGQAPLLGLMGTQCYEIKFRILMKVADICNVLVAQVGQDDFDGYARARLAEAVEEARQAPAVMAEWYRKHGHDEEDL